MNYKIEGTLKKSRKYFIIFGILWLVLAIVLVAPIEHSSFVANTAEGGFNLSEFIDTLMNTITTNPLGSIGTIFSEGAIGTYLSCIFWYTVLFLILVIIGMVKMAPKTEYTDIEHGSSDWSEHGEQYRILSNKKGIILAEDNYLPLDKRGNINVLVVGRIWIW